MKRKLLFVCTGNICRSPLAHRLFEKIAHDKGLHESFEVDSCGTGAWHEGQNADYRMVLLAKEKGWTLEKYARKITPHDMEYYDVIFIMDTSHEHFMQSFVNDKSLLSKVRYLREYDSEAGDNLQVSDPYYGGRDGFINVYDMIERSCLGILESFR